MLLSLIDEITRSYPVGTFPNPNFVAPPDPTIFNPFLFDFFIIFDIS